MTISLGRLQARAGSGSCCPAQDLAAQSKILKAPSGTGALNGWKRSVPRHANARAARELM
jgi:hypothetical protein